MENRILSNLEKEVLEMMVVRLSRLRGGEFYIPDVHCILFEREVLSGGFCFFEREAASWMLSRGSDINAFFPQFADKREVYKGDNPFAHPRNFQLMLILDIAETLIARTKHFDGKGVDCDLIFFYDETIETLRAEWNALMSTTSPNA